MEILTHLKLRSFDIVFILFHSVCSILIRTVFNPGRGRSFACLGGEVIFDVWFSLLIYIFKWSCLVWGPDRYSLVSLESKNFALTLESDSVGASHKTAIIFHNLKVSIWFNHGCLHVRIIERAEPIKSTVFHVISHSQVHFSDQLQRLASKLERTEN